MNYAAMKAAGLSVGLSEQVVIDCLLRAENEQQFGELIQYRMPEAAHHAVLTNKKVKTHAELIAKLNEALEIGQLCEKLAPRDEIERAKVNYPEMAVKFVREGKPLADARTAILTMRAEASPDICNHQPSPKGTVFMNSLTGNKDGSLSGVHDGTAHYIAPEVAQMLNGRTEEQLAMHNLANELWARERAKKEAKQ